MNPVPEGILLLDKPGLPVHRTRAQATETQLPTSHDMVQLVRRTLNLRRVGHTGTLDPFASGLLVVCVGRVTRLAEYYQALPKTYVAGVRFGAETDTGDITGQFLPNEGKTEWDAARVAAVLPDFVGRQWQVPPAYSAKRISGQRAYARARAGERVELDAQEIHVYDIAVLPSHDPREMSLCITCGAGTYVRSLAQDIARKAGTRAFLSNLRRTALGDLSVKDAWTPDDLVAADGWRPESTACLPPSQGLPWPRLQCNSELARRLGQGQIALLADSELALTENQSALAVTPAGDFLGVLVCLGVTAAQKTRVKATKWLASAR